MGLVGGAGFNFAQVVVVRELSLFTGAGGGLLGTRLLGWRTVCAVEWEPYCQAVLLARQADGILERFPIWDDVRTFKGADWRGKVDVITAGFPCQPFSTAGKRKGESDERNMWPDTIRVIREVGPEWCLLENVPGLTAAGKHVVVVVERIRQMGLFGANDSKSVAGRLCRRVIEAVGPSYLGRVFGDLAEAGFDTEWGVFSAAEVGAPHQRDRLWIVAHAPRLLEGRQEQRPERERTGVCGEPVVMADTAGLRHAPGRSGESVAVRDEARGPEPERRSGDVPHPNPPGLQTQGPELETAGVEQRGPDDANSNRFKHQSDTHEVKRSPAKELSANPNPQGQPVVCGLRTDAGTPGGNQPDPDGGRPTLSRLGGVAYGLAAFMDGTWEDGIERVSRRVAHRVDRLKAIGNGQCPITLVKAWKTLSARFNS